MEGSPHFGELWPEVAACLSGADYLAAHNASFDKGVMDGSLQHYGLEGPTQSYLDTVQIARQVWKIYPTKLNLVCEHLSIPLKHHEALSDARACAKILLRAREEGWQP